MTKKEAKEIIKTYKRERSFFGIMNYYETNWGLSTRTIGEALVKLAKVKLEN